MELPLDYISKGYRIPGTDIFIDPLEPVRCAIISHAHGDHAVEGHENVYCSKGTAALISKRFSYPAKKIHEMPYGESVVINGIKVSLHPAGHMLGSSQVRWEKDNKITVYSGDYKREEDRSCEAFEVVPCDTFITEVTFGQTDKQHPSAAEIVAGLDRFDGINMLIGAYNLGKAQRLTRLINDHLTSYRVMIHPKMIPYHKVYEAMGFELGPWEPYKREAFKHQKNIVYLVSPATLLNFRPSSHFIRAFATGWEEKAARYDFQVPVSDHADWPSLIRTIKECGAKDVFTIHGEGEELKQSPELSGINIHILRT